MGMKNTLIFLVGVRDAQEKHHILSQKNTFDKSSLLGK